MDQLTARNAHHRGPFTANSIGQGKFNFVRTPHQRLYWNCQSFKVKKPGHPLQSKSFSICNLCHTCLEHGLCLERSIFRPPFSVKDHTLSSLPSFGYGCTSFRHHYFVHFVTSICCTPKMGETTEDVSYLRQSEFPQQALQTQIDNSVSDIVEELVNSVTPKSKRSSTKGVYHQLIKQDSSSTDIHGEMGRNVFPLSSFMERSFDSFHDNCGPTDPISKFAGAGCTSNRSVNFFLVDSIEHWTVAERLGVSWTSEEKIALVIADFKVIQILKWCLCSLFPPTPDSEHPYHDVLKQIFIFMILLNC